MKHIKLFEEHSSDDIIAYHGTNNSSDIIKNGFSLNYTSKNSGYPGVLGVGIYATTIKDRAKLYGKNIVKISIPNRLNLYKIFNSLDLYIKETDYGDPYKITKYFKQKVYDGIHIQDEIVIFDPKNITILK